ncbi:DUF4433 domain-containing protein [Lentzea sp. NPDC006480]|uniref:type II toxin-antitoxin system toxin DNA ADP-ribosyl transferase DarT n=1 Tax=Lentzea sp. NPDC006480 TaxID=3157176 RepID=UPI0033A657CB
MAAAQAETLIMHFTPIANLPGIVEQGGMWCDAAMSQIGGPSVDCAAADIKARRREIPITASPYGSVGDYVPFYFAPRSPMLFRIHKGGVSTYGGGQDTLIYLVSSVERVTAAGLNWVGSDGNCAAYITQHYNDWNELHNEVDWPLMKERYWSDTEEDGDRVRRRQAEFLVHRFLPLHCIGAIITKSEEVAKQARAIVGNNIPVHVRPNWYF